MTTPNPAYKSLLGHLAHLTCDKEIDAVLSALLTDKEQQDIANRVRIFDLLQKGVTQRVISQQLGVGIATVSRGARALQQQDATAIDKLLATHRQQEAANSKIE